MFIEESRESCWPGDGRAWEVDGRAQALVGPGLATPLPGQHDQLQFNSLKTWIIAIWTQSNIIVITTKQQSGPKACNGKLIHMYLAIIIANVSLLT